MLCHTYVVSVCGPESGSEPGQGFDPGSGPGSGLWSGPESGPKPGPGSSLGSGPGFDRRICFASNFLDRFQFDALCMIHVSSIEL